MLERVRKDVGGSLLIFSLLMAFWLLISASSDWQHIVVGVIPVAILTIVWSFLTVKEGQPTRFSWKMLFRLAQYLLMLIKEIIMANIQMAMIVLNPRLPISPALVIMRCDLKKDLARVAYVNSITLTPGTITVDLNGDQLIVHAVTKEAAYGVEHWYLYPKMKQLEEDR